MIVFADTWAIFALLIRDDDMHERARANFQPLSVPSLSDQWSAV